MALCGLPCSGGRPPSGKYFATRPGGSGLPRSASLSGLTPGGVSGCEWGRSSRDSAATRSRAWLSGGIVALRSFGMPPRKRSRGPRAARGERKISQATALGSLGASFVARSSVSSPPKKSWTRQSDFEKYLRRDHPVDVQTLGGLQLSFCFDVHALVAPNLAKQASSPRGLLRPTVGFGQVWLEVFLDNLPASCQSKGGSCKQCSRPEIPRRWCSLQSKADAPPEGSTPRRHESEERGRTSNRPQSQGERRNSTSRGRTRGVSRGSLGLGGRVAEFASKHRSSVE